MNALAWSPDGRYLLSGGADALVLLYGVQEGGVVKSSLRHREPVLAVAWLDGGFVVTMSASEMHIWQIDLEH